ncbi:MAG: hypothetical protein WKF73_13365 [Nocardioidaceae bacterium]
MVDELIENYPYLYHMAWEGSWPPIRAEGLLTTRQLVDACDPDHDLCDAVLARPRPLSVMLHHPTRGAVTIRDQAPLRENVLIEKLTDMTIPEWLESSTAASSSGFTPTSCPSCSVRRATARRHTT